MEHSHHPGTGSSWPAWLGYLIVALVAAGVYGPALRFSIDRFDEDVILGTNIEYLKRQATVADVVRRDAFFELPARTFYRPVQNLTFLADVKIGRGKPWMFHATNILLHALASCLLLSLLRGLRLSALAALGATLLFAVSPLLTQAIAWTPGRGDLLLGVFSLAALLPAQRYLISGRTHWLALTALSTLLAVFSKESGVVLAALLPASWLLVRARGVNPTQRAGMLALVGIVCAAVLMLARAQVIQGTTSAQQFDAVHLITSWRVLPEMTAKFALPWLLQPLAGFTMQATATGLLLLGALTWYGLRGRTDHHALLFGLVWFAALTLPGMMYRHPSGSVAYDYLEHRGYAPAMGLAIIIGLLLARLPGRILMAVSVAGVLAYGASTMIRLGDFANARTFTHAAVEANPGSGLARTIRGQLRAFDGDTVGAVADLERAASQHPDFALGRAALGRLYLRTRRTDRATVELRAALRLDSSLPDMAGLLARAYRINGNLDSALLWYRTELERDAHSFDANLHIGSIEASRGNLALALVHLTRATEEMPFSSLAWYNRGQVHRQLGALDQACQCWQRAADLSDYLHDEIGGREARAALQIHCGQP